MEISVPCELGLLLCTGRAYRSDQRSLFTTTAVKCQHALVLLLDPEREEPRLVDIEL